ncbi:MAG: bifunctional phosphoribosylaminoimidazolecarboxamide formyltransferase/IMP cyclohydrolase, partial [Caldisericia bacterium]|nr:bifunctional phosphoribosylaminoimidazolecarboxamide formyltransferase/IMP cyclohydrolase [Caldisericia bacterium]
MITIKNALISVSDKKDLKALVELLSHAEVHLYATESTHAAITKMGFLCEKVENYTAFPPILHGRVKTLHPKIFGGILGRTRIPSEVEENKQHQILKFDLVCVNLYPFSDNVSPETPLEEKLDLIDIGGVSLLRASGKNYIECITLSDPSQYPLFIAEFTQYEGCVSEEFSQKCMVQSFLHTSMYDAHIAQTFSENPIQPYFLQKSLALRYGENPHQKAGFFHPLSNAFTAPSLPLGCHKLHGKDLSYNNLLDVSQGLDLMNEYGTELPACIILKHTNPCGAAASKDILDAYKKAYQCDPVSAFGGVFIFNQEVNLAIAEHIHSVFVDVVCAPSYATDALQILTKKKNIRLLEHTAYDSLPMHLKDAGNGFLVQDKDQEVVKDMEVVCGNPLSAEE